MTTLTSDIAPSPVHSKILPRSVTRSLVSPPSLGARRRERQEGTRRAASRRRRAISASTATGVGRRRGCLSDTLDTLAAAGAPPTATLADVLGAQGPARAQVDPRRRALATYMRDTPLRRTFQLQTLVRTADRRDPPPDRGFGACRGPSRRRRRSAAAAARTLSEGAARGGSARRRRRRAPRDRGRRRAVRAAALVERYSLAQLADKDARRARLVRQDRSGCTRALVPHHRAQSRRPRSAALSCYDQAARPRTEPMSLDPCLLREGPSRRRPRRAGGGQPLRLRRPLRQTGRSRRASASSSSTLSRLSSAARTPSCPACPAACTAARAFLTTSFLICGPSCSSGGLFAFSALCLSSRREVARVCGGPGSGCLGLLLVHRDPAGLCVVNSRMLICAFMSMSQKRTRWRKASYRSKRRVVWARLASVLHERVDRPFPQLCIWPPLRCWNHAVLSTVMSGTPALASAR